MDPVYIFNLAAAHSRWATMRQAVITGNIANANTNGYTAQDIEPFSALLDDPSTFAMAGGAPGDISGAGGSSDGQAWKVNDTGAPVTLDQELVKADDVNRSFALDTSIVRAFHQMLLESLKSAT